MITLQINEQHKMGLYYNMTEKRYWLRRVVIRRMCYLKKNIVLKYCLQVYKLDLTTLRPKLSTHITQRMIPFSLINTDISALRMSSLHNFFNLK